jgi:hypothetical protein
MIVNVGPLLTFEEAKAHWDSLMEPRPNPREIVVNQNGQTAEECIPLDALTYLAVNPDSRRRGITFPNPEAEAGMAQRAAWLGMSKEQFFQEHLIDGKPVEITKKALRNQVRWLIKDLLRMQSLITLENREPEGLQLWLERVAEVFSSQLLKNFNPESGPLNP